MFPFLTRDSRYVDVVAAVLQVAGELWFLSRKSPSGHPGLVGPIPAGQDGLRSKGFLLYWLLILKPDRMASEIDRLKAQHVSVILPTG